MIVSLTGSKKILAPLLEVDHDHETNEEWYFIDEVNQKPVTYELDII